MSWVKELNHDISLFWVSQFLLLKGHINYKFVQWISSEKNEPQENRIFVQVVLLESFKEQSTIKKYD